MVGNLMIDQLPPLTSIPADCVALGDYESLARERVDSAAWAYLNGGAADELTVADNIAAFRRLRLLPRVLRDLRSAHTRVELFGDTFQHPIFIAPMALHRLAHEHAELATMTGASAAQAGMIVSTESSVRLETIAQSAQSPLWFQLYLQADRGFTRELVQRAEASGYRALVLTVDAPINGVRNREQRSGFRVPSTISPVNLHGMNPRPQRAARVGESPLFATGLLDHAARWSDVEWLRKQTRLPIILKGILHADDAHRAIEQGAAGLIVSNHGGRTLDTVAATIDVLPAIAERVDGRVPVLLDGGIRRGTDVLKALALGASAILVGRPILHGLAAAGAAGVAHVLTILHAELEAAMALSGCATVAEIHRSLIWTADNV
jgi:4-hydroxymandelate oxidase